MAVLAPRLRLTEEQPELDLRTAVRERTRARLRERRGQRMSFMAWALQVPEPKAGVLNFNLFPMQRELYAEGYDDREVVVKKGTQVGVSAWGVRWAMYHTDLRGMTGLYVFPTLSDVYDFSDARIKTVIEASDYLRARVLPDDPQNKGLKKIGLGFIYFRGSESKRKLDSVDADHLVLDEYDTLQQANIPDAERRLSGPLSKGLIRRLGVPSIPAFGIAKAYDESDQRKWFVRCEACNEWQPITFFDNVDQVVFKVVCRSCRKPLDVRRGEWVAAFPDRGVRGYHVTRLLAPTANIEAIVKQSKKRSPTERQVFFNKDLGEEYAPAEGRLSREAIAAAQREFTQVEGYSGPPFVTMGVDIATVRDLNVRISLHKPDESKVALFIGMVEDYNVLDKLMTRYNVNMTVIDHLPEGRLSRAFAERHPGRVYVCHFDTTTNPKNSKVITVNDDMREVAVRRTEVMDATAEMIRSQMNLLPLDLPEGYVENMQAPVRVSTKDEFGKVTVGYKSMGDDDYFMAEAYDVVATECWWFRNLRDEQDHQPIERLEDHLEFERSHLADPDAEVAYDSGMRDAGYYEGGSQQGY